MWLRAWIRVSGFGFQVSGSSSGFPGSGFLVPRFRVPGSGIGSGIRIHFSGSRIRDPGSVFRVKHLEVAGEEEPQRLVLRLDEHHQRGRPPNLVKPLVVKSWSNDGQIMFKTSLGFEVQRLGFRVWTVGTISAGTGKTFVGRMIFLKTWICVLGVGIMDEGLWFRVYGVRRLRV